MMRSYLALGIVSTHVMHTLRSFPTPNLNWLITSSTLVVVSFCSHLTSLVVSSSSSSSEESFLRLLKCLPDGIVYCNVIRVPNLNYTRLRVFLNIQVDGTTSHLKNEGGHLFLTDLNNTNFLLIECDVTSVFAGMPQGLMLPMKTR